VTNNGSVQMLSMTFSNTNSYTVAGTGTITLASSGASNAAINTLAGAHVVSTTVDLGSSIVLSNAGSSALTIDGVVTGLGGLVKQGDGTTTLAASNSFSGGTIIDAGRLVTTNANALGAGNVTLNTGGTLEALGTSSLQVGGDLIVEGGTYLWNLYANANTTPGIEFTSPLLLS
jgi:autotransporter-associated beta strand protein